MRPAEIQTSYKFSIGDIPLDRPQQFRQDNLTILVIKRSDGMIDALMRSKYDLQDPESRRSHQPEFAINRLRSKHRRYFVSYAQGTDLGCTLVPIEAFMLAEGCGDARYDFSGRALSSKNQFQNLAIPDYNFSDDFKSLIIKP